MFRGRSFIIAVLVFLHVLPILGQNNAALTERLLEVREASYYDSATVFSAGNKMLEEEKNKNASEVRAEIYIYYGNHFFYTRNISRAKYYYELALHEAEACGSSRINILAKVRLAYIESENEDYVIIENQLKALTFEAIEQKDYENLAEILNMRAILNENNGNPKIAAKLYLEGLNLSETHHLEYYEATFHNNLGLLKFSLDDTENALLDFSEVIRIAKKINNQRLLSHAQLNLSLVLIAQKNYKEAHDLFDEVIAYSKSNNHPSELANAYANLGGAYVLNKNPKLGLLYIDSSLYILKKYNLKDALGQIYVNKSQIMIEMNDLVTAEATLKKADEFIPKNIRNEMLAEYYYTWYELCNKKHNYKKALEYHELYTDINEGLQNKLNTKALEELQFKYTVQQKEIDLEKEKTKTALLEKAHQEDVSFRWIILATTIILLFLTIAFFYTRYTRAIREEQDKFSRQLINNTEEERSRIAKDLHDDIGQSLSILKSKFTNKNQFENSEIISKEIERVIDQTRQISKNLFPSYLEKIGLKRAISSLSESVQNTNHIECSFDVVDNTDLIPSEIATHIYRIIQECLNNTIKHSRATALKILLNYDNGYFTLVYMDNGNFKKTSKKDSGIGLLSIKERSKIINGTLHIDENDIKGFKLSLKFKIPN